MITERPKEKRFGLLAHCSLLILVLVIAFGHGVTERKTECAIAHCFVFSGRFGLLLRYLKAALDAGEVVYRYGVLKKGFGLCHGVSGNG